MSSRIKRQMLSEAIPTGNRTHPWAAEALQWFLQGTASKILKTKLSFGRNYIKIELKNELSIYKLASRWSILPKRAWLLHDTLFGRCYSQDQSAGQIKKNVDENAGK